MGISDHPVYDLNEKIADMKVQWLQHLEWIQKDWRNKFYTTPQQVDALWDAPCIDGGTRFDSARAW